MGSVKAMMREREKREKSDTRGIFHVSGKLSLWYVQLYVSIFMLEREKGLEFGYNAFREASSGYYENNGKKSVRKICTFLGLSFFSVGIQFGGPRWVGSSNLFWCKE